MGVDKTEEILYKAYEMGIYHEVIDLANKIGDQYPLMVVSDKLELALHKIKEEKQRVFFYSVTPESMLKTITAIHKIENEIMI